MSIGSLRWGSLHNVRDLGGLPTRREFTQYGRIFRSPSPDSLTADGWQDLRDDGVATLLDLRNDYEVGRDVHRPAAVTVLRRPIEDQTDADFMSTWGDRLGSPAYYPEILARWSRLVADAFVAIAEAPDGAILIHCAAGRDRTGMIASMLLELVGVNRESIYEDYEAGVRDDNLWLRTAQTGRRDVPMSEGALHEHLESARSELAAFLDAIDVEQYLIASGVTSAQVKQLRSRLIDA